jgi:uncharacterized protein YndB with AHSA1/START domain
MSEQRFVAQVEGILAADISRVWEAFATQEGFAKVYEGITVGGDWKVGGAVVWSGEWEGKAFKDEGVVLAYDRPRLFSYSYWTSFWGLPRTPEHTQTIENRFEAVAGGTKVTITQGNIATEESRVQSTKNWEGILAKMAEGLA